MGYIYKITNTISGKCYIGETKQESSEKRWKEHIKSINKNKGCPALKDAIKKYGLDKFKFEIIIICFDQDRFIYEKEYIKKYNCQVPNGYNILPGGIGGAGFQGKKHTDETIQKMIEGGKQFRKENPNHYETYREKHKESMKNVDISSAVKNSEKWKKAVEEGRVGSKSHKNGKPSEETKNKIRESIIKYYKENSNIKQINIEKHREAMAKAKGKKVAQYTNDNEFIKEYNSISEAGRVSGIKNKNISSVLCGRTKTAGGYIWKYIDEKDLKA
jgi:group I intron endonuclease